MKIHSFEQIRIPNPCHEDWNTMTSEEQGRFCTLCNKTVYDFSNVSIEEFNQILTQEKNNLICGQFKVTQLKNNSSIQLPLSFSNRISRALRSLMKTFGVRKTNKPEVEMGDVCISSGGIAGTITDNITKIPLNEVSIDVYANNVLMSSTQTDNKGYYKISWLDPNLYTLTLTKTGYQILTTPTLEIKYEVITFNPALEKIEDEKMYVKGHIKHN